MGYYYGQVSEILGVRPRSLTLLQQAVESRELQRIWGKGWHERKVFGEEGQVADFVDGPRMEAILEFRAWTLMVMEAVGV